MKKSKLVLIIALFAGLIFTLPNVSPAWAGSGIVAGWDFEDQNSTADEGIPNNDGVKLLTVGGGVSSPTFTSVGDSAGSYGFSTSWHNGANTKYWQVEVNTTGITNMTISSKQRSTGSFWSYQGPRDFKIQYSLNGSTWTDVPGGSITVADNWTTGVVNNLALPSAINNQSTVYLRWIMTSNTGVRGDNTVASDAQSMINDIFINGTESPYQPTDITVDNDTIAASDPANTTVGTLSTTDPNFWDSYSYSLVSGTGDTHNSSFYISGNQLKTQSTLSPGTYSIRVNTNDGTYNFAKVLTINVTPYPVITGGNTQYGDYITNVTFAGIDNDTGDDGGYGNYTAQIGEVTPGMSYSFSSTIALSEPDYYPAIIVVWFDWNQDYDFNDANEKYTVGTELSTSGPHSKSITVPAGAQDGNTRMRIVLDAYDGTTEPPNSGSAIFYGDAEDYTINVASGDSDGNLTAAGGVSEPVDLPTTVDTVGEAVNVFDFAISDGGGGDALALDVSQLVLHTSGTGDFSQVTWRLDGPDASNVAGTYNSSANTLTFSGLNISIAEGDSETYTLNAYFNDNTGLSEGQTYILSIDGDTDLTVDGSGTQMASTSAVNNGTGSAVAVTATRLVFSAQPSSPTERDSNMGPVTLQAQDAAGNVDTDFTETVSLTDEAQGAETDGPGTLATSSHGGSLSVAASSGQVSWANLSYDTIANINIQATSSSFGVESDNVTVQGNSDGNLTAAGGVSEPVNLLTTADTVGEAVNVFDFSLSDGGGGDNLPLDVSQLVLQTSGTGDFSQVTWRLDGPDASNVEGTYNSDSNTLTFSGLSISVADGGSETYTLNGYFNDNTGLSEGQTYILSIDGDTDLTVSGSGTQMATTSAVNNSTGSAVDVTATQLVFSTQPTSPVAANSNLGPVTLQAQDGAGNVDTDFTETVSLTDEAQGAETDGPGSLATTSNGNSLTVAASSGQVSWANLTYDTDANINIQASSSSFGVESNNVTIQSNQAPVALADAVTTIAGQALTIAVLGNDTDADGDPLSVSAVTQGTNGSVSNNGSTVTYTPGGSYTGTDTFTYSASDGSLTDTAAVSVTVVEGDRADPIDPTQEETITIDNHLQSGKFLSTTIELPPGSVPDSTTMVFKEQSYSPHNAPSGYYFAGMFFSLDAYVGADHQSNFTFTKPVTLTFYFNRVRRPSLRYWDGNTWSTGGITMIENDRTKMVVTINHLTEFALFSKVEPVYLPLVFKGFTSGPDLVVESVTATSSAISVTIRNGGDEAVTDPFWVDVYFDPTETPSLNQPWNTIAAHGAVWGVTAPIPAGDSLTLTVGDAYYASQWSSSSFPTGAQVYAYVDSINYETSYGNVQESNENNNLSNPVTSTAGQGSAILLSGSAAPLPEGLPAR